MSGNKFKKKYRVPSARWADWDYGSEGSYYVTICTKNRKHSFGEIENGEMIYSELGLIAVNEWIKSVEIREDMQLDMSCMQVMPNHIHGIVVIGRDVRCCRDAMHGVSTQENATTNIDAKHGVFAPENASINRDAMHSVFIQENATINRDAKHGVFTPENATINGDARHGEFTQENATIIVDAKHGVFTPENATINGDAKHGVSTGETTELPTGFGPQSKNLASIMRGFKSAVTIQARLQKIPFDWQERFHDRVIRDDEEFRRIAAYIEQNPLNWENDRMNS